MKKRLMIGIHLLSHCLIVSLALALFQKDSNQYKSSEPCMERSPPMWPLSLTLVQRRIPRDGSNVEVATTVTFYDFEKGVNLIQIFLDDGTVTWDLELNNRTSYYFNPLTSECRIMNFDVGILRPNWLDNAEPLGESEGWNGRPVCGWTKGPKFIDYFEDKETREPNTWYFYDMDADFNTIYFGADVKVPYGNWFDPPTYCQNKDIKAKDFDQSDINDVAAK